MAMTEMTWSKDQYLRAVDEGVLVNTQLIDGKIHKNVTPSPTHRHLLSAIIVQLINVFGPEYVVRENPIELDDGFPEPDATVLRVPEPEIEGRHPAPADIAHVVEVAVSSVDDDVKRKAPSYAEAGITSVFVVVALDDDRYRLLGTGTDALVLDAVAAAAKRIGWKQVD